MSIERKKYCVNGEWKESKTEKWLPVTDSSTGEPLGRRGADGNPTPWPTRAELLSSNAFAGTELVWLQSPLDVYICEVNGSAKLVDLAANLLRRTQSGFLYHYAFAMILGLIALLAVLMTYWR